VNHVDVNIDILLIDTKLSVLFKLSTHSWVSGNTPAPWVRGGGGVAASRYQATNSSQAQSHFRSGIGPHSVYCYLGEQADMERVRLLLWLVVSLLLTAVTVVSRQADLCSYIKYIQSFRIGLRPLRYVFVWLRNCRDIRI
jgi:hypothetical protein